MHATGDRASTGSPIQIDFSAESTCPIFQCPITPPVAVTPWDIPPICIDDDSDPIEAYIGYTGGEQGYTAITGKIGLDVAWYLNGLLIPEVYIKRGSKVVFFVNGGNNETIESQNHPLYITSSKEGALYAHPRSSETVYGPPTTGEFCMWEETAGNGDQFDPWSDYKATLESSCGNGITSSVIQWQTDENTPDMAYYQCAAHHNLGWKIYIVDDLSECPGSAGYLTLPFSLLTLIAVLLTVLYGF
ncbi:Protein Skeletor, isoforms D/E-like [Oopsacas minuta]|uniref:Protein Skeletor, isoforms D/E-like n=1 Tax=Oopsacas minuta TaxID=111878 RepID=A0AAV7KJR7_9METZ|nr:Protein Skeletor, isoforms D/E-like [Oopsacas minuta]